MGDSQTNWDFLYIFDGADVSGPLIQTLTGHNQDVALMPALVSTGAQMFVRFTSDWSVQTSGFQFTVQCPSGPAPLCGPCEVGKYLLRTLNMSFRYLNLPLIMGLFITH